MNITEKVKKILMEISDTPKIELNTDLRSDLLFDSLLMVTLLIEIEAEFNIELNESDMDPFKLKTVQNVIDMISKYTSEY